MASHGDNEITLEEARAALEDPVKGSLRVLKALGKKRDEYRKELEDGAIRLEAENELEQVAAEAALDDYLQAVAEDGERAPKISIVRPKVFQWK
jgi:phosphosulfolactate synthase (CoM biosynthesis protein A)